MTARLIRTILSGVLALIVAASTVAAAPAGASETAAAPGAGASRKVTVAERREARSHPIDEIVDEAEELRLDVPAGVRPAGAAGATGPRAGEVRPEGPEIRIAGQAPARGDASRSTSPSDVSGAAAGTWAGGFGQNPNRQVGKLYFDKQPGAGTKWGVCSATVVSAGNRSTIVTAGHCVFNPDPDQDGRIQGNGYWYEQVQFCPGYEYGCKLGRWYARRLATTTSWFQGVGGRYNFSDDVAVVLLSSNGRLVQDVTGGQGIIFNRVTGLQRHSFGYPAPDSRFPGYRYDGEDLVYTGGVDVADTSIPGTLAMRNTMTGGSSGGPWITAPGSNWLGYVNSVNSHKPYGAEWMSGPYFGAAEANLYTTWSSR